MKLKIPTSPVVQAYIATQPESDIAALAVACMTLAPHALHFRQFGAQLQSRYPCETSLSLPVSDAMFRYMDVVRFNTACLHRFFVAIEPRTLAALRRALTALNIAQGYDEVRHAYQRWRTVTPSTPPSAFGLPPQSGD